MKQHIQKDKVGAQYFVAITLYHEGYGYNLKELEAIGSVVKNRFDFYINIKQKKTWEQVCSDSTIFKFWASDDCIESPIITDPLFAMCSRVAGRVIAGILKDTTNGALRYHHSTDMPHWARGKTGLEIGDFIFYN